ncbi:hypothetical protein AAZX31_20G177900 [Glycine max]
MSSGACRSATRCKDFDVQVKIQRSQEINHMSQICKQEQSSLDQEHMHVSRP